MVRGPKSSVGNARQLYVPQSLPTRQTSRTYTVDRPSSMPVAGLQRQFRETPRYSLSNVELNTRNMEGESAKTVSMDDVYAVDEALARRQSIQPPAYAPGTALPQYLDSRKHSLEDEKRHSRTSSVSSVHSTEPHYMSLTTRILIPFFLVIPILTALGLSYFGTSQSESIRKVVDVVHIRLPQADFDYLHKPQETEPLVLGPGPLIPSLTGTETQLPAFTPPLARTSTSEVANTVIKRQVTSTGTLRLRSMDRNITNGGTLAVGLWGWSLTPVKGDSVLVSPPQVWDQLYDLFPPRNTSAAARNITSSLSGADFPVPLGRMLFLHSVGVLLTMVATVPVLIYVFRKHVRNNPFVNAGWMQHGSLVAATLCTFAAWIIDQRYLSVVRNNLLDRYTVSAGVCPTLALSSACLLGVATLASTIPILLAFLQRQQSRSRQWTKVMEVNRSSASGDTSAVSQETKSDQIASRKLHSSSGSWRDKPSRWTTLARKGRSKHGVV